MSPLMSPQDKYEVYLNSTYVLKLECMVSLLAEVGRGMSEALSITKDYK